MGRRDLLSLSPQSLASLSNWGLVKRAGREIEKGLGPRLEEDENGCVTGHFPDGTVAVLLPARSLSEGSCTCGATGVCRHRVAVVLAYPAFASSAAALPGSGETPISEPREPWSPAQFSDQELGEHIGKRERARAAALLSLGIPIEIKPAALFTERSICEARLPMCTVLFHVPGDLRHAECTCAQKSLCEHVLLAIWAFRRAPEPALHPQTVRLGPSTESSAPIEPLEQAQKLAADLLLQGVERTIPEYFAHRCSQTISSLENAGFLWPAAVMRDILHLQRAYVARSARYSSAELSALLAELWARGRAVRGQGVLTARFVLGRDETPETRLNHARLITLGARLRGGDQEREVCVYLADVAAGVPLVLRRRLSVRETQAPGFDLQKVRLAPGVSLGALAHGQMVSRSLRRLADHSIVIAGRGAHTSLAAFDGDYSRLPSPLLIQSLSAHEVARRAALPRMLRPRVYADNIRVLQVDRICNIIYRPGDQEIRASLFDAQGDCIELVRRHSGVVPGALDSLASVLLEPSSPVRFVCGEMHHTPTGTIIEPSALVAGRLIVPDLEMSMPPIAKWPAEPVGRLSKQSVSPHGLALLHARTCLEELCHDGLMHARPACAARANDIAQKLKSLGLFACAGRLVQLNRAIARLRGIAQPEQEQQNAVEAWFSTALRVFLSIESI